MTARRLNAVKRIIHRSVAVGMASFEENTHVFIVRLWTEPREIEGALPLRRGVIEHVATGERRYVSELAQISSFILPFIESAEADAECRGKRT